MLQRACLHTSSCKVHSTFCTLTEKLRNANPPSPHTHLGSTLALPQSLAPLQAFNAFTTTPPVSYAHQPTPAHTTPPPPIPSGPYPQPIKPLPRGVGNTPAHPLYLPCRARPPWCEGIHLIKEQHTGVCSTSTRKQLPHRALTLTHILVQQLWALQGGKRWERGGGAAVAAQTATWLLVRSI